MYEIEVRNWFLATLVLLSQSCHGQRPFIQPNGNQVCLLVPPEVEECYRKFHGKPIDTRAAQINCLQKLLWNFPPRVNLSQSDVDFFRSLLPIDQGRVVGVDLPPTGRRVRKEYRLMSARERHRFHAALNKLYEDGTIARFARLHAVAADWHYNGPSFLPWNRVFLAMFEEALRRHDSTVSLPYWDSSIDNDMDNPVNSVIWSAEYFGAGVGDVVDGPAAEWVTNLGTLERNYGHRSKLLTKEQIRNILSQCNLRDISKPFASRQYDIEYFHGGPQMWVGGDMQSVASAGFDPVFYMHHAFIDYIWELFRRRQFRRCGVDPAQDYPNLPIGDSHAAGSRMFGFDWLTNRDGIKYDWVDNWYDYESTPSCPNCCEGCSFPAPVYCDRLRGVCVGRSRRSFAFGPLDERSRSTAQLDPREVFSLQHPAPPRNRGREFQAPTSDGRTIFSAIDDTFDSLMLREEWRMNGNGSTFESFSSTYSPSYTEPLVSQRITLYDGTDTRSSDLQMASRQSDRQRIISETGRTFSDAQIPNVYRTVSDPVPARLDQTRAFLDSPAIDRPLSISDAPISLTDVRTSFSSRTRPVESLAATDSTRGFSDIRMSSFNMSPAPADRGVTSSDPMVAYSSPQMSLYERPVSYQDPMVLPDRRGSMPSRQREYITQQRNLPDPRKVLISRTRRVEPVSSGSLRVGTESQFSRGRDQTARSRLSLTDRTAPETRRYVDFAGR